MSGFTTKNKYKYYRCKPCHCNIRATIEDDIIAAVRHELSNSTKVVENIMAQYEEYKKTIKPPTMALERVRTAQKGIENILQAVEQGMDYKLVKERLEALQRDKNAAEYEIKQFKERHLVELDREKIRKYLEEGMLTDDRLKFVERCINRIDYSNNEFRISLNIGSTVCLTSPWLQPVILKANSVTPSLRSVRKN